MAVTPERISRSARFIAIGLVTATAMASAEAATSGVNSYAHLSWELLSSDGSNSIPYVIINPDKPIGTLENEGFSGSLGSVNGGNSEYPLPLYITENHDSNRIDQSLSYFGVKSYVRSGDFGVAAQAEALRGNHATSSVGQATLNPYGTVFYDFRGFIIQLAPHQTLTFNLSPEVGVNSNCLASQGCTGYAGVAMDATSIDLIGTVNGGEKAFFASSMEANGNRTDYGDRVIILENASDSAAQFAFNAAATADAKTNISAPVSNSAELAPLPALPTVSAVPENGTLALFALGLSALALRRRPAGRAQAV